MDCLPNEILQQICLNLEGPEFCPPKDLASFSQVNHVCNRAAVPILYRHITLIFKTFKDLEAAVSTVTEAPQASLFMRFARRLSVVCIGLLPDFGSDQARPWTREPWAISAATDRIPATRKGFLEHDMTSCYFSCGSPIFFNDPRGISGPQAWTPVVSLIASLNQLEQFDFVTTDNFSTGLMEVFARHHPHCKLNLLGRQAVGSTPDTAFFSTIHKFRSKFDMQTLRLPGLHTLHATLPFDYRKPGDNQQLDEIIPSFFISSGLKHLSLMPKDCVSNLAVDVLKPPSQSLIDISKPGATSQLESVTLQWPMESILFKLAAAGDLSQLRTLDIGGIFEPEKLVDIARLLPNLKRLFIGLNSGYALHSRSKTFGEESIAGIVAFRPLEYLYIRGFRSVEGLDKIIQRHGLSLKGLALVPNVFCLYYPELCPSDLLELAKGCPNLEELRVPMKRSMGNQTECDMYKSLGTFPNLQRLFLDLEFMVEVKELGMMMRSTLEAEDPEVLRQTFINAAMDQSLAFQIWSMIRNKSARLKELRILPLGSRGILEDEVGYLVNCFARSYLLTGYNIENPGVPVMEQIGKRALEIKRAMLFPRENAPHDDECPLSNETVSVLRRIWPQVPEPTFRSDWRDCWTSMPLQPALSPSEFSEA